MTSPFKFVLPALGIVAAVAFVGVGASYLSMASKIATAPSRVINRTLDTGNIISSYEWFHDMSAQFDARTAQIVDFKSMYGEEKDAAERSRLRIELAAMQQSCREIVTKFNANAAKMNKAIFKDRGTPDNLDMTRCN
jgi:hypothetical protein